MADQNQETIEIMERVNREMSLYGQLTRETADAYNDAKVGIKGFSEATRQAGGAIGKLGQAGMQAASAMYEGKKGAAAFNSSVDSMAESAQMAGAALALLIPGGPAIKLLIAGVTAAATAYAKYTKAANEMSDGLYMGYQKLSKAGAAASDGLTGVYKDLTKLGMGMQDLDSYVKVIGENSKDLAMFGGTVFQGKKQFVEMGAAMQDSRKSLMALGMSQEDIAAGGMKYIALQNRIGQAQGKTTAELADGAKKYLVEMDGLSKLTGQSRQEMEAQMEAARSEQRFRAKLDEMRANGQTKQADELEKANLLISSRSKEAGQAFRDLSTGMVTTEAAQKGLLGSNAELLKQSQRIAAGQATAAEGATIALNAQAKVAKDNRSLALAGAFNDTFMDYAQSSEAANFAAKDFTKSLAEIKKEQAGQMAAAKGGGDALLAAQVSLRDEQIKATKAAQDFVFKGTVPATENMIALAKATGAAAEGLNKLINGGKNAESAVPNAPTAAEMDKAKSQVAQLLKDRNAGKVSTADISKGGGASFDPNTGEVIIDGARAQGGDVKKGSTYLVGEKGPEIFVPSMAGDIIPNDMTATAAGASADKATQIEDAVKSIIADTKKLEKITDSDTIRVAKFSDLQKKFLEIKTTMLQEQLADMEEQNKDSEEITEAVKRLEKLTTGDLQRSQKYSDVQKKFFDLKTSILTNQLKELSVGSMTTANAQEGTTASTGTTGAASTTAQANTPAPSSGTGLKAPQVSAPSSGAGGAMSQSDLAGLGLKIKAGDVQAEGAGISPKIIGLAEQVQANMPGFAYFSGFNDKFHQEKSPSSFHTKGQAMDFALNKAPTPKEGQEIVNWLKDMGASYAIDEYNNPSSKATAGHIHAQIAGYADGGIAEEPQIAMVAEKGPEAMIPLKNGAIPVEGFSEAVNSLRVMQDRMSEMVAGMAEMLREQRTGNDSLQKIYQVSAN